MCMLGHNYVCPKRVAVDCGAHSAAWTHFVPSLTGNISFSFNLKPLTHGSRLTLGLEQHLNLFSRCLYRHHFIRGCVLEREGGRKIFIYDPDNDTRIGSGPAPSVCNPSAMLSSPVSMVLHTSGLH